MSNISNEFIGVGIDIEAISRFELDFDTNKKFYQKIFTEKEIKYCLSKPKPARHFAARFCAKEAFIKAMSLKIIDYAKIEIGVGKTGEPKINWQDVDVFLSISHDEDKAIATVNVFKSKN